METLIIKRRIWLLLLVALSAAFAFQMTADTAWNVQASANEDFKVTTIYFVRHAERSNEPAADPVLNEAGIARSQALARMLEKAEIKAIYTSQFRRAIQTAEPLAAQLGITVAPQTMTSSPSNPREVSEESLQQIINEIYKHSGESLLVIGHTNTIPQVIKMLGGDAVPAIDEQAYDDLFIVTLYEKGKAKVIRLKY